jgi:hypothetical protein
MNVVVVARVGRGAHYPVSDGSARQRGWAVGVVHISSSLIAIGLSIRIK